ncbi:taste receptor type 2 member 40-like [Rana temporaria]|uniref:taste receptor type 2 member 40-like n=1 Tax=Rana temporaria TaxID=8407 RepID=UPI001AAD1484|nr:taste receptor type 2 member 40-like [Rana temporaria]
MVLSEIVSFSIAVLESLLSLYFNSYIVAFHVRRLRNKVKLNPPSLLQLVMGATNISMRGMVLGTSIALLFPIYHVTRLYHATLVIVPIHLNFSYWLIAWLSTYYCTTITNIRIFIWMKRILVSFLPHLLFLSAVVSFILSIQSVWYLNIQISFHNSTLRSILPDFKFSIYNPNVVLIISLCSSLPFLVTLGALVVTMSSLFRHIRKVKKNDSGFAPPNLQAHVRAMRTMILFLLLSILSNVAEIFNIVAPSFSFSSDLLQFIIWLMVAIFPLAEAVIIIQSSRKLKEMVPQIFCVGRLMGGQN